MYRIWTPRTRGNMTVIIATWKQSYINVITACVTPARWVVATVTEISLSVTSVLSQQPSEVHRSFIWWQIRSNQLPCFLTRTLVWRCIGCWGWPIATEMCFEYSYACLHNNYNLSTKLWSEDLKGRDILEDELGMWRCRNIIHLVCEGVTTLNHAKENSADPRMRTAAHYWWRLL